MKKHDTTLSNVISRNDHLQSKAKEVNEHLAGLWKEKNISLIDHTKK